jgi:pyrroloquinoline quinone (PQQ) biosynthesis protein C
MTTEQSNLDSPPATSRLRSPIREGSRPLLRSDATFSTIADELVVATPHMDYGFRGSSATTLLAINQQLDASLTVAELAARAGVAPAEVAAILEVLSEEGDIVDLQEAFEYPTPDRFLEIYYQVCRSWVPEVEATPFMTQLMAGTAPQAMVLGWGIETYHYVESANEHMPASVAYCRNDTVVRRWLAQHYVEEHGHGQIFLDGLEACGLSPDQVRRAPPLASTRALINFLIELATNDGLAYAGTFGAMRGGSPTTAETVTRFYDHLVKHYGFAHGLAEAFHTHSSEDVALNHDEIVLSRWLRRRGHVSPDDAQRILRAARGMVDHFVLYFEGIHDYYGARGSALPRRPCDVRWDAV